MNRMNSSVETVNAAATAIVTAENRVQQVTSPRRRWGGWLSMYWCFGAQGHGKRINHAVVIPEATLSGSAPNGPENITYSPPTTLPFVAPPSSPASFLQSEPPSAIHSPVGLFSLSALSANAYSPGGPNSIFAIGPYAYETQLVSPPAFTTEPSTAPFTPPPESVHMTTPPSPEVPFAELLMSSFDLNLKKSEYNEFHSYQMYPGSPIGNLISPSSVCSGTSSLPDPEFYSSISDCFPSFPLGEPPELLTAEDLAMRKRMRRQPSLRDGLVSSSQGMESDSLGEDISDSRIHKPVMKHWMSFELTEEEVAYCLEKESVFPDRSESESHTDAAQINTNSPHQIDKADTVTSCCVDEAYHDSSEKLNLTTDEREAKEFKFDNADGSPGEPSVESDWWANKETGSDADGSKNWTFFPPKQICRQKTRKMPPPAANIVTLNVGGQLFQTSPQTLDLAGPNSFLATFSSSVTSNDVPFIDRDPDLFSILLSFLRTGRLPSKADTFDLQDIAAEAQFYGIDPRSVTSCSDSSNFDGFDLRKSRIVPLNGRDSPSAIATTPEGSVHVAHGSKITSFDWLLCRKSTMLTSFPAVDSLVALSTLLVAAGAMDFPGLRVLDVEKGVMKTKLNWASNPLAGGAANSTVQAIGHSPDYLFGSFESSRRNSNAIVAFDLGGGTLRSVIEFGRGEIYGADLDSAIPATKLSWVPSHALLMASGSHGGPSGLVGNIKLWDVRSCTAPFWEVKEQHDCFADVVVSDSLSAIFKVGVNSGNIYMMDLRKLNSKSTNEDNKWICLGEPWTRTSWTAKSKEGSGCRIASYRNQVFCVKGCDVEMWSEVVMGDPGGLGVEDGVVEGVKIMKRNVMGRKDDGGSKITHIGFGGNRMVLTRKDQQFLEIWERSVGR